MLRRARERAAAAGLANVRFLEAAAGAGAIERGAFDRAILVTVLGEIPNRAAALAEIFAALKPGGVLAVTEILPDPHYQRESTVRRLAAAAGFRAGPRLGPWWAFTLNLVRPRAA
jgi:ubiquinone/menaquinone biosynthesis C-methylase UbiE